MGWAASYIDALGRGETVRFRPRGNSMRPRIESGALVEVAPVSAETEVSPGDAVLCRVGGREYLHLVLVRQTLRSAEGPKVRFQIGNASGRVNGWTGPERIFGKVISVNP